MRTESGMVLVLVLLFSLPAISKNYQTSGGFYLQYFGGRVDPAKLPHVYKVFEAVRNVSDKHANRWPELLVIRDLPGYQVLALPDGHIVLSSLAVKLIYKNVSQQTGNTRLAFMLGHELAHLAEDDFWDAEMAQALLGSRNAKKLSSLLGLVKTSHAQIRKETQADDKGLLYAALAGYPVAELLDSESGDFLTTWTELTGAKADDAHAPASARANILRSRLKQRLASVEQFRFAVRLAHFGRCEDALQMFANLQTLFPGRSLFNNIAYCRLQQALEAMPAAIASLYWLPQVLDAQSRLTDMLPANTKITLRSSTQNSLAKQYLQKAVKAINAATEMDPYYVSAWINQASIQLLRGEIYQARAAIEKARKLAKNDLTIESMRLLIIYEEGLEMDVSPKVIKLLQAFLQQHPNHAMTHYNLARILTQRGRMAQAKSHWKTLATNDILAPIIKRAVCQNMTDLLACQQARQYKTMRWGTAIAVGADLLSDEKAQQQLQTYQQYPFQLAGLGESEGIIYQNDNYSILDFDRIVEMVVLRKPDIENTTQLRQKSGQANWKQVLSNGEIWNYKSWAAWVQDNRINEIWIASEPAQ